MTDPDLITAWLRTAIVDGNVSAAFNGEFPRYVWSRLPDEEGWFEARLVNEVLGQYKGYPLDLDDQPIGAV